MKIIIDANLSWRLIKFLKQRDVESVYATQIGVSPMSDRDIWAYAMKNGFSILTQDADFSDMVIASQDGPPVIWLRKGNLRNHEVEALMAEHWQFIFDLAVQGERLIEIL
jgi:predicted nuclease of predicted toxin-antitoxin system